MLRGAIDTLEIGSPANLSTDIGPVIDSVSKDKINKHVSSFSKIFQSKTNSEDGYFVPISIIEISSLEKYLEKISNEPPFNIPISIID